MSPLFNNDYSATSQKIPSLSRSFSHEGLVEQQIQQKSDRGASNAIDQVSLNYQSNLGHSQQSQQALVYSRQYSFSQNITYSAQVEALDNPPNQLLEGAKNILSFIDQRLAIEQSEGASPEILADLLRQGLEGFELGFSQAIDLLGGREDLGDVVGSEIDTLYQQVQAGFDELRKRYLDDNKTLVESNSQLDKPNKINDELVDIPVSETLQQGVVQQQALTGLDFLRSQATRNLLDNSESMAVSSTENSEGSVLYQQSEYRQQRDFTFELKTQEGDVIRIQATNDYSYSENYGAVSGEGSGTRVYESNETESGAFQLEIVGDLSKEEQAAINDLLNEVFSLADEFYNGDVLEAYEAALALDYDREQIMAYALNLRQQEQYTASSVYQQLSPTPVNVEDQVLFETIGEYAENLLTSLTNPVHYTVFDYAQLLQITVKQLEQQRENQGKITLNDIVNQAINNLG